MSSLWQRTRQAWLGWAKTLKHQTAALYFACRDPQTSRLTRIFALIIVAYALSPIDLIPDFIPVIGYLDDLLLLPLGVWLVIKTIPDEVWQRSLLKATETATLPQFKWMKAVILAIWLLLALLVVLWITKLFALS